MALENEEIERRLLQFQGKNAETLRLARLEKNYKEREKTNNLDLKIKWINSTKKINEEILSKGIEKEFLPTYSKDFIIKKFNLDKVLNYIFEAEEANVIFPKDKLYGDKNRFDINITKVIDFIENKKTVCPPLIEFTINKDLAIKDGNHRIALCRFLKLKSIPFLIRKTDLKELKKRKVDFKYNLEILKKLKRIFKL